MENNEMKFCQSCAMPLENADLQGTNIDGSKNDDYCVYCYKDGTFTSDMGIVQVLVVRYEILPRNRKLIACTIN